MQGILLHDYYYGRKIMHRRSVERTQVSSPVSGLFQLFLHLKPKNREKQSLMEQQDSVTIQNLMVFVLADNFCFFPTMTLNILQIF